MELQNSIIDDSKIIIELENKKALIATGFNYSLSNEKSISILENEFKLIDQYMGSSLEDVNNSLGIKVDYLLGSDILSNFNYSINTKKNSFLLSTEEIKEGSNELPLTIALNVPHLPVKVNGKEILVILDSTSKYSYLHEKNILNKESFKEKQDFFLSMGNFDVKIYNVDYIIGTESNTFETGIYPKVITKSRFLTPNRGVLGIDLLKKYLLTINSTSKKVFFEKF